MRLRDLFRRSSPETEPPAAEAAPEPHPAVQPLPPWAAVGITSDAAWEFSRNAQQQHARDENRPQRREQREEQREDQGAGSGGAAATAEMARAVELRARYFQQMTLENTPAAFMDDRYTYDDDVWMSQDTASDRLEGELRELVRAHPDQFAGTQFEPWLHDAEPEHLEREPDGPEDPETDDDEPYPF